MSSRASSSGVCVCISGVSWRRSRDKAGDGGAERVGEIKAASSSAFLAATAACKENDILDGEYVDDINQRLSKRHQR